MRPLLLRSGTASHAEGTKRWRSWLVLCEKSASGSTFTLRDYSFPKNSIISVTVSVINTLTRAVAPSNCVTSDG